MFITLVRRFILKDILDLKVAVLFAFCAMTIPVGCLIAGHEYQQRRAEHDMRVVAGDSIPAPRTLGVVAQGVDAAQFGSPLSDYVMGSQTPDLLFVVRVVLSLVAILMGALSLSEEKRGGILKVAFTGPLPRHQYILARAVAGLLSVSYPFLLAVLVGAVIFVVTGVPLTAGEWWQAALAVAVAVVYLGVSYAAGLLACVAARSGSTWELRHNAEQGAKRVQTRFSTRVNEYVRTNGGENLMQWMVSDESGCMQLLGQFLDSTLNGFQLHAEHVRRRIEAGYMLSRISPFASFISVSQELSGTGGNEMVHLSNETLAHASRTVSAHLAMLKEDVAQGRNPADTRDMRDIVPRFAHSPLPPATRISNALLDFGLLVAWTVLLFCAGFLIWLRQEEA